MGGYLPHAFTHKYIMYCTWWPTTLHITHLLCVGNHLHKILSLWLSELTFRAKREECSSQNNTHSWNGQEGWGLQAWGGKATEQMGNTISLNVMQMVREIHPNHYWNKTQEGSAHCTLAVVLIGSLYSSIEDIVASVAYGVHQHNTTLFFFSWLALSVC